MDRDKLDNLKPPAWLTSLPGMGFAARSSFPTVTTATPVPAAAPTTQVNITVTGALDPYAVAVQIQALLARYDLAVA